MLRSVLVIALLALPALGANQRLYLADGNYHLVREYEVKSDRVRFYSLERSQWEEIPLQLVDLDRTEREIKETQEARQAEAEFWDKEEAAERSHRREVSRIPVDPGVYMVENDQVRVIPVAELEVVNNKRRSILKAITPIPIVAGKQVVWIKGLNSPNVVNSATPQFYLRLSQEQRFGIIRLNPDKGKGMRQVEEWAVLPVTDEILEQHHDIEIFRRQVGDNLYQLWPEQPLEPGEYAVVEFSPGAANIQVWDFRFAAGR